MTAPPDLISCLLGQDKLIRFEQVHRTLRESQALMQPVFEQLHPPNIEVGSFPEEFSQRKANVTEFSFGVSCCL